jgi:hypothetical protein
MSKRIKIFLISLLVLFTLAASLFIYIYQHVDQLKKYALQEVNYFLKSELAAKQIDVSFWQTFPKVSLALHEVSLSDPLQSKIKVLKAQHVYLGFDIYDVLKEQYRINFIEIDSGTIYLYTNQKGKNNFDIVKDSPEPTDSKKPFSFELKKLVLTKMQIELVNEKTEFEMDTYLEEAKFAGKFTDTKFTMSLLLSGFTKQLRTASLELIRNKAIRLNTDVEVDQEKQKFTIYKGDFSLNNLALTLQGWVQTGEKQSAIDLSFKAKTISIQDLLSTLPLTLPESFKAYQSNGNVFFDGMVKGFISDAKQPKIEIKFGVDKGSLLEPNSGLKLENIYLAGSFLTGVSGKFSDSKINIPNFSASLPGSQIKGSVSLENLDNPLVNLALSGDAKMDELQKFFQMDDIKSVSGSASFSVKLKGKKAGDNWNWKFPENEGIISASIPNLSVTYLKQSIKDIALEAKINGDNLLLNKLNVIIDKSDLSLSGNIPQFVHFLLGENNTMLANLKLRSNYLNAANLLIYDDSDPREADEKPISYLLNISLEANELLFEKLNTKNCKANVVIKPDYISFQNASMEAAKGFVKLNGEFAKVNNQYVFTGNTELNGLDIGEILVAFDNFGQAEFSSKNIFGNISGSSEFRIYWDINMNFIPEKLIMLADMSLKNGSLLQYKPLLSLSKFVDVNELNNLKFSELKNTLTIKDKMLFMPAMEIKSNAFNLLLSGKHSFNNDLDYKVKVSLSEILAKKRKQKQSEFDEEDTKTRGINLYLSIKGNIDNLKFEFDKRGAKEQLKQDIKVEKEIIKEILKQELGVKKDSSLKKIEKKNDNNDELEFEEN